MSWLVDVWAERVMHGIEARRLAHEDRLVSVDLLAVCNRPQSVVDLNLLRNNVYELLGVKP